MRVIKRYKCGCKTVEVGGIVFHDISPKCDRKDPHHFEEIDKKKQAKKNKMENG